MEPTTETGNLLLHALTSLLQTSPAAGSKDSFQRILYVHSPKIINEDVFIASLYGQGMVDRRPLDMIKQLGTSVPLLRVQHVTESCFEALCHKELIVALEWSNNHEVLTQLLQWAETEIQTTQKSTAVGHAPNPGQVSALASALSSVSLTGGEGMGRQAMGTPRIRSLDWDVSDKLRSMRVLNGQIILMWQYEIRVYSLQTLECTRKIEINIVKSYLRERLDYADSNGDHVFGIFRFNAKLRMWNVKTGRMLLDKIKINRSKHGISKMASVSVLRCWKNDVVIGSSLGELTLWEFKNKTLKFKHKWMASFSNSVDRVELDDHVIVSLLTLHFLVEIWDKGGNRLGKLHGPEVFTSLRYFNGLIAASWTGSTVKIWNASTGECIGQVAHSDGYSTSVEINGK